MTIQLSFSVTPPLPSKGYVVKYGEKGQPVLKTIAPNPMTVPINITVPGGKHWVGTVQAQMSDDQFCEEKVWEINDKPPPLPFMLIVVSSTQEGICTEVPQPIYLARTGARIFQGDQLFFDPDGLQGVGDAFAVDASGVVFGVVNSIVTLPTGTQCY